MYATMNEDFEDKCLGTIHKIKLFLHRIAMNLHILNVFKNFLLL